RCPQTRSRCDRCCVRSRCCRSRRAIPKSATSGRLYWHRFPRPPARQKAPVTLNNAATATHYPPHDLVERIRGMSRELGFQQTGISDIDLAQAEERLAAWLRQRFHGQMGYMSRHGPKRSRPELLVPGTVRVISVRMDYLPQSRQEAAA